MKTPLQLLGEAIVVNCLACSVLAGLMWLDKVSASDMAGAIGFLSACFGGLLGCILAVDECPSPRRPMIALFSIGGALVGTVISAIGALPAFGLLLAFHAGADFSSMASAFSASGGFVAGLFGVFGAVLCESNVQHSTPNRDWIRRC